VIRPCGIGAGRSCRLHNPYRVDENSWVSGLKLAMIYCADESNKACRAFSSCLSRWLKQKFQARQQSRCRWSHPRFSSQDSGPGAASQRAIAIASFDPPYPSKPNLANVIMAGLFRSSFQGVFQTKR